MAWSTFWRLRKYLTNLPKLSCGFKHIVSLPRVLFFVSYTRKWSMGYHAWLLVCMHAIYPGYIICSHTIHKPFGLLCIMYAINRIVIKRNQPQYRVAQKERNSRYSRFSGLCSNQQLLSSLCWIEHLLPIIITSRSSNLVENFLFYETFLMDCHFVICPISRVLRHDDKLMANPKNDSR